MDPHDWQRVKALFHDALRLPPEQRDAHVVATAGDDHVLLAEVRALLAAHDVENDGVGSRGVGSEPVRRNTPIDPEVDTPGALIDRYRILQPIGEGGFGTVFMAEQLAPIRRRVAFKILKAGMDTRRVLARFEAEQQALARMEHPNIAKVLDAGATVTGRPYFVMELIRGIPITTYCDQAELDTQARLGLFLDVCRAIQHAHQKGIIHRDIKPSNVLVMLHDGTPVPKVIDFGIAKATDQRLTDKTLFTGVREMIGSPEYMAPEQAELSGLDVDTRADIYSLGVLLYELLTGTKPFDLRDVMKSGFAALLERIRDIEPPKPSSRIATLGDTGTEIARHRATDLRQLTGVLRGDLDWIVMKAIAKDRTRRYETANGLALDIERFLRLEPVTAGPPTWRYRLGKLARRNRASFIAAGAVLTSLVAGLAIALWQFGVARANEIAATNSATLAASRESEARQNLERARLAETQARELLAAEAVARREATAHRLSAQAIALAHDDPGTALQLAIEGARLQQDDEANIALYTAVGEHRSLARLDGHDARSHLLEVSADRHLAISADDSSLVIVWNLIERRMRYRFDVHEGAVRALGFAADSALAFSAGDDGSVRLWRMADGATAGTLQHPQAVLFAAIGPSGATLTTVCADGDVREWSLQKLEVERTITHLERPIVATAATSDLRLFAALDADMVVSLVDLTGRVPPSRIALSTEAPPPYYNIEQWYGPSVALSRDGSRVLTRDRAGHAALWDATTGARVCEYAGRGRFCGPVALSPDARRVFLLRRDPPGNVVRGEIVDATSGELLGTLEDPRALGERARAWFSPDGYSLLTIYAGKGVLWNAGSGAAVGRLEADPHGLFAPRFVGGDEEILTGSQSGPLYLFARSAYPERRALTVPPAGQPGLRVFAASPDGARAAVSLGPDDARGPMLLVDTANGRAIARLLERTHAGSNAWFSPDGGRVAAVGPRDQGLVVFDVAGGRCVFRRSIAADHPRFGPDGRYLVALSEGKFKLWDVEHDAEVGEVPSACPLPAHPSKDGTLLVTADGPSATVSVWNVATARRVGIVEHVAFSFDGVLTPDGRYLISIANDARGQIRDAATLRPLAALPMPTADFASVNVSPDGSMVAISARSEILVYEVPSGRRFARWRAPRNNYRSGVFRPDGRALVIRDLDEALSEIPLDVLAYARSRSGERLRAATMQRFGLGSEEEREARARQESAEVVSSLGLCRAALQLVATGHADSALEFVARARAVRLRPPAICDYAEACARAQRLTPHDRVGTERALGLAALRRFAASGQATRAVLESAPLLGPLRTSPEFAAILDTVR